MSARRLSWRRQKGATNRKRGACFLWSQRIDRMNATLPSSAVTHGRLSLSTTTSRTGHVGRWHATDLAGCRGRGSRCRPRSRRRRSSRRCSTGPDRAGPAARRIRWPARTRSCRRLGGAVHRRPAPEPRARSRQQRFDHRPQRIGQGRVVGGLAHTRTQVPTRSSITFGYHGRHAGSAPGSTTLSQAARQEKRCSNADSGSRRRRCRRIETAVQ